MSIGPKSLLSNVCVALLLLSITDCSGSTTSVSDGSTNGFSDGSFTSFADGSINGSSDGSSDRRSPPIPTVLSTAPTNAATDVPLNGNVTATFDQNMDRGSLTPSTFTLTTGSPAAPVVGTVVTRVSQSVFWPAGRLAGYTRFSGTITTGVRSAEGASLASAFVWTFTTGSAVAPGRPVNLGTAGGFVILAKSAISTVPTSAITGDIGVSPVAATAITGFPLTVHSSNVYATTPQVTGRVYAADYSAPTPANLTAAIADMELALTEASARAPDVTELGAGNIGGLTLAPGVYKWGTGLLIPTDVTLSGNADAVWVFQVAQGITLSNDAKVILSGGALARNVFWQASGAVDLGTSSEFAGNVLSQTAITARTGATIRGRLLAQTAVNLQSSTVTAPSP